MHELTGQLARFSFAGVANTLVGYAVIFGGMALGISPYSSNVAGYAMGLICSFLLNQTFVFAASGNRTHQLGRFLSVFAVSYLCNFTTLHICLLANLRNVWSQILAGVVYSVTMFLLSRWWVFKK